MPTVRYFTWVTIEGATTGRIFRLTIDDDAETITEEAFDGTVWVKADTIVRNLVAGEPRFEEISEGQAREITPAAFTGRDAPSR